MDNKIAIPISIILAVNSARIKANGAVSLYIKIRVGKDEPVKLKLPFEWPVLFWDKKKRELMPRYANDEKHAHYTAIINLEIAKYWKVAKNYYLNDKHFTVTDIIKGVREFNVGNKLAEYIIFRAKQRLKAKEIKESTRNNHVTCANKLLEYLPYDVDIDAISSTWLKKYLKWLMLKNAYGGAWSHVKTICTYVRDAKNKGMDIADSFEEFKLVECDNEPTWLERFELDKLIEFYNNKETAPEIIDCLRGFLFACFTGLRISDLKRFDKSWIVGNEIVFTPVKARITQLKQKTVRIPIIDVAAHFIQNLGDKKIITRSAQKLNSRLKTIATIANIPKNLTMHVARHTFGTSLAVAGVPVIVISKLMGHSKIETTMVYIHIAENIRQMEMLKLQASFADFLKPVEKEKAPVEELSD